MIDPRNPDYSSTPGSARRPDFGYGPADIAAKPVVSIITPYFNTGPEFLETVRCVIGQSLQAWEWLIIDDGTSDAASLDRLQNAARSEARIRVLRQESTNGPSAGRNAGAAAATAPYLQFLDADDLIEPTALEKCAWFLATHPQFSFVKGLSVGFGGQEYLWRNGFHHPDAFPQQNVTTITAMIRREVHKKVGGFDESLIDGMEDWEYWLRCADAGYWGTTIPEFLDWYRRRAPDVRRWKDIDGGERARQFAARMRDQYPRLFSAGISVPARTAHTPFSAPLEIDAIQNALASSGPRLLMIVPWLRMGGADKFNIDLISELRKRGWETSVVTTLPSDHDWAPEFTKHTPDVFMLERFLEPRAFPAFLSYLIRSRRPDVVMVSNSELGYLLLPYLRAECPEPAYIDYCHMEEDYWRDGGYPRFAVGYEDQLDLNAVASQHLKQWMVRRGADCDRIEVATINVDPDVWQPDDAERARVRQAHLIPDDKPVILYAGRLCEQKQPKVFARTMLGLARRNVDFLALVAGDGPDRQWLVEFTQEHELQDQVWLLGARPTGEMRGLLAASDVFFLPSLWEGIALSIYEAMSMGLPVVGADVGGQKELVTPECGSLLPRGTADEEVPRYVEALAGVLSNPKKRARMGAAARKRIREHFPLDRMGDRMVEILDRAMQLRASSPRPTVSRGLAREIATQALEHTRISRALDELWAMREQHQAVVAERDRLAAGFVPRARRFVGRILRATGVLSPRSTNGSS